MQLESYQEENDCGKEDSVETSQCFKSEDCCVYPALKSGFAYRIRAFSSSFVGTPSNFFSLKLIAGAFIPLTTSFALLKGPKCEMSTISYPNPLSLQNSSTTSRTLI